jgi:hypothetical protein
MTTPVLLRAVDRKPQHQASPIRIDPTHTFHYEHAQRRVKSGSRIIGAQLIALDFADILVITDAGLEFYKLNPDSIKFVKQSKANAIFYRIVKDSEQNAYALLLLDSKGIAHIFWIEDKGFSKLSEVNFSAFNREHGDYSDQIFLQIAYICIHY